MDPSLSLYCSIVLIAGVICAENSSLLKPTIPKSRGILNPFLIATCIAPYAKKSLAAKIASGGVLSLSRCSIANSPSLLFGAHSKIYSCRKRSPCLSNACLYPSIRFENGRMWEKPARCAIRLYPIDIRCSTADTAP